MRPRVDGTGTWRVDLRLISIDKGDAGHGADGQATVILDANRMVVRRPAFDIEYINDANGMRQNFIVKQRPRGDGPLTVRLACTGTLEAVRESERDVVFVEPGDGFGTRRPVAGYTGLTVWDAAGAACDASVEVDGNRILLVVDDTEARYPVTIDPLALWMDWRYESDQAEAAFGVSVSSAGDVNGDGFSDVIVGADTYDDGEEDEGAAFLFYGSTAGLGPYPDWMADGDQVGANFGAGVSGAGDVNGDGYADIVVGAPNYDGGEGSTGAAFVYLGGPSGPSAAADWFALGDATGAAFGGSVSNGGDVNGDGYSDILVGAPSSESSAGAVFLFHGSSDGPSATAAWTGRSGVPNAQYGTSVASAGDVNGDGYSDVIVGAPRLTSVASSEGRAFVYYGGASGLSAEAGWEVSGSIANAWFGSSVSSAGDVNGDGYSDVVVGAMRYNDGEAEEGAAFVYHGSVTGLSTTAAWMVESNSEGASYGSGVAAAGDLNGDGFADIIVAAFSYDNSEENTGAVFAYLGSDSGLSITEQCMIRGGGDLGPIAGCVAGAGDINGDGYSDIVVGCERYSNGQASEGAALAFCGDGTRPAETPAWERPGRQPDARFGNCVSSAGDVNGDGYADVVVGAHRYGGRGAVFLYYGGPDGLSTVADWQAQGSLAESSFGHSVSCAGDVNGDGYADIVVGAHNHADDEHNEGAVYLYYGSPTGPSAMPDWQVESNLPDACLGYCVSGAGDVNGDGYGDIVAGAFRYSNGQTTEGAAYVYHGGPDGPSTAADWMVESNSTGICFGMSVSGAGDVNGDGYGDIIVGAYRYSNGQTAEGAAFVYQGSANGLSTTADWMVESDQEDAYLGVSVSGAGDVNGDGYNDVIVGATGHDGVLTDQGLVSLYYGSPSGLHSDADWSQTIEHEGFFYGGSVSGAGDLDGDGYGDIVVGARAAGHTASEEGAVFVYFGGNQRVEGPQALFAGQGEAWFGHSVSGAGDIDGDGFADIVIGAPLYNDEYTDEGIAFAYYGGGGSGMRANTRQYQNDLATPLAPNGRSGHEQQAGLGLYATSFLGRQKGKLVYEYMTQGQPFSGALLQFSVEKSGEQISFTDLGTTGADLRELVTGLSSGSVYKWRARVMYDPVTAITGQVYGPWRFMPNDLVADGGFRCGDMSVPPAPTLTSPVDQATGVSTAPTVQWETVSSAASYQVQVNPDSAFADSGTIETVSTGSSLTVSGLLNNTRYYWRVAAANTYGTGPWSVTHTFTTVVEGAEAPELIAPADDSTVRADSSVFTWRHSAPAVIGYRLMIAPDSLFASMLIDTELTDTAYIARFSDNGTYYWRVAARNDAGWGVFSAIRRFTVAMPVTRALPERITFSFPRMGVQGGVVRFGLPAPARVAVRLYDLKGTLVRSILNETVEAGYHTVAVGGDQVGAGQYLLYFTAGDCRQVAPVTFAASR